jgi:hypothetical protein
MEGMTAKQKEIFNNLSNKVYTLSNDIYNMSIKINLQESTIKMQQIQIDSLNQKMKVVTNSFWRK